MNMCDTVNYNVTIRHENVTIKHENVTTWHDTFELYSVNMTVNMVGI